MKKLILLLFVLGLFSCTKNPEDLAKENVEKFMKAKLDDPKSYESVKFSKMDSLFTSFDESKDGIELKYQEDKLSEKSTELSNRIGVTESISEINKILEENKKLTKTRNDLIDTFFAKSLKYKGAFCGYKIKHSFRAKNKMGALVLDSCCIVLDTLINVKYIKQ